MTAGQWKRPPRAVVFIHGCAFQSPVNRSHQIARHFADRLPVIYAPYRSMGELLFGEWRRPSWKPLAEHPAMHPVSMPLTVFLSRRSRAAASFHGWLAARRIRRKLRELAIDPLETVIFAEAATAVDVPRYFPGTRVMYDCADDLAHWYDTSPRMTRLYLEMEQEIARRSSWVVVSIPRLAERFAGCGAEIVPGLNAVSREFLEASLAAGERAREGGTRSEMPPDLAAVPGPRLVFVGVLSPYLDAQLVAALARAGLGSVVLVGPVDPRAPIAALRGHPNIYWLGHKEHDELPAYVAAADVALLPVARDAASDRIPSKLVMYCAAGVPIVATACSSFEPYGHCVRLARDTPHFMEQVRNALREPEWGRSARIQLAREHTWERLSAALLAKMGIEEQPAAGLSASLVGRR